MAYRCKVCGYKFKKSDDDLCPQCFTARDDVHCFDTPGHSHGFDTSNESNSFIDHEKMRENIPSVSELSGQAHRAADELQKKYQTYQNDRHKTTGTQKSPYLSQTTNKAQDSFQARNAMNNNAAARNSDTLFNYSNYQNAVNALSGNKSAKKTNGCLVAFILLFFIFPIIGMVLSSGGTIMKAIKDAKNEENGNKAHKIETPDIEMPDINMPSIPDYSSFLDGIYSYDYENASFDIQSSQEDICGSGARVIYSACYKPETINELDADNLEYLDHRLSEDQMYQYELDFVDSKGDYIDIEDPIYTVTGIDANGTPVFHFWNQPAEKYILVPETVWYYSVNVVYFDDAGNQKDMIFDFDINDLPSFEK